MPWLSSYRFWVHDTKHSCFCWPGLHLLSWWTIKQCPFSLRHVPIGVTGYMGMGSVASILLTLNHQNASIRPLCPTALGIFRTCPFTGVGESYVTKNWVPNRTEGFGSSIFKGRELCILLGSFYSLRKCSRWAYLQMGRPGFIDYSGKSIWNMWKAEAWEQERSSWIWIVYA